MDAAVSSDHVKMRSCGLATIIQVQLFVALWSGVAMAAPAPSSDIPSLFNEIETPQFMPSVSLVEPGVIRSRLVKVDLAALNAARAKGRTLTLNLFKDKAIDIRVDGVKPTRSGYFLHGQPHGSEYGEVRLLVRGPIVVGTLMTTDAHYTIRWGGGGRHVVREVDDAAIGLDCELPGDGALAEAPIESGSPSAFQVLQTSVSEFSDHPTESGAEVRILVLYTRARQRQEGGAAGMRALVDFYVESTNHAFEKGGIEPRLVLVHTSLTKYEEVTSQTDLRRLRHPADDYLDEAHVLRNRHAADLAHLLTIYRTGPAGTAGGVPLEQSLDYSERAAFGVTAFNEVTFAHEIGHAFGVFHTRKQWTKDSWAAFPYAYGYVNKSAFEPGSGFNSRWRTLMATNTRCRSANISCKRIFRYSNPDQTYLDDPLGVPKEDPTQGEFGPADARLTINQMAAWVGSFRSESCTEFRVVSPIASAEGGEVRVEVETAPGCLWKASGTGDFFELLSLERVAGSNSAAFQVQPNKTGKDRVGLIEVAGKKVELRQLGTDRGVCGRTYQVMREMVRLAGFSSPSECSEVNSEHLANVRELDLSALEIQSLKTGDFDGLVSLRDLDLSSNKLSRLPGSVFGELRELRTLKLGFNRFEDISPEAFVGLERVYQVNLDNNLLSSLSRGVFSGLEALSTLIISHNRLETVDPGAFEGLENLERLYMDENRLEGLPDNVFDGLAQVEYITLHSNRIAHISDEAFKGLEKLESLNLQRNQLTHLTSNTFGGLGALSRLDLSRNNLKELPEGVLSDSERLAALLLERNDLADLHPLALSGLRNLTRLILHTNEISTLSSEAFADLAKLEVLDLRVNRLLALPENVFSALTELQELEMSVNRLSSLPEGLFDSLVNLRVLNLWNVPLLELPEGLFHPLSKLERLMVSQNGLKGFHEEAFRGLHELKRLYISDTRMETVPPGLFRGLNALELIRMSSNRVKELPAGVFGGLSRLRTLELEWNYGIRIPVLIRELDGPKIQAEMPTGAPFEFKLPFRLVDGKGEEQQSGSFIIRTGEMTSEAVQISPEDSASLWLKLGEAPGIPVGHSGYGFEFSESRRLNAISPSSSTNASLIELSVDGQHIDFKQGGESVVHKLVVPFHAEVATVQSKASAPTAKIAYLGPDGSILSDADDVVSGQQIQMDVGENLVSVRVSSEDDAEARTYTLQVTRDGKTGVCGRTPQVRDAILKTLRSDAPCFQVTRADLESINDTFSLYGKWAGELRDRDFSGFADVYRVDLRFNNLYSLPDDVFADTGDISEVSISLNNFRTLPVKALSKLRGVKDLYMTDTPVIELPANGFASFDRLEGLIFLGGTIRTLQDGAFNGLSRLNYLNLDGNFLAYSTWPMLAELPSLENLRISDNEIAKVDSGAFAGLPSLRYLDLARNRISELAPGAFAGLPALESLTLEANSLEHVEAMMFDELSTLEKLHLSYNEITRIPPDLLRSLPRLRVVTFHNNSIQEVDHRTFSGLGALEELRLDENRIAIVNGSTFSELSALVTLGLSGNELDELPEGLFSGLARLEKLNLSENSIDPLPLRVALEGVGNSQFKVVVPTGAPFGFEVPVSVSGPGAIAGQVESVSVAVGEMESAVQNVVRIAGTSEPVAVSMGELPLPPDGHSGYQLQVAGEALLNIPSPKVIESAGPVVDVQAVGVLEGIEVAWRAAENADGYKIQWRTEDQDYSQAEQEGREALLSSGQDVKHTVTGLVPGVTYWVRVMATRAGAYDGDASAEMSGVPLDGDADVTGDGSVDDADALVMYYAFRFPDLVGAGFGEGLARYRQALLLPLGAGEGSDGALVQMISRASAWRVASLGAGGDINEDGAVGWEDALVMYYAYRYGHLVGDGAAGGNADSRQLLLSGLSGRSAADDAFLMGMVGRANAFRAEAP